jgi:hypothetical protein
VTHPSVFHILTGMLLKNSSSHGKTAKTPTDIHHCVSIVYSFSDLLPNKIVLKFVMKDFSSILIFKAISIRDIMAPSYSLTEDFIS